MRFEIKMPEQRDDDDEEGMMTTTEKGVTKTCTVASSIVARLQSSSAFFSFDSLEQKRQETHLETERK